MSHILFFYTCCSMKENYYYPVKTEKAIKRGLNRCIYAEETSSFNLQAPVLRKALIGCLFFATEQRCFN